MLGACSSLSALCLDGLLLLRQIFIQQPNRHFTRTLILTQSSVILYHFDRSGVTHTTSFNFHNHPIRFVQLIIGLSSKSERALGLDDSVQWVIADGRKVSGTIRAPDEDGKMIDYDLVMDEKPFIRHAIRGRGTTCFPATHPKDKTKKVLVKSYWMADGRTPETEIYKQIKGVEGVCEMIAVETDRKQTKDFRPPAVSEDLAQPTPSLSSTPPSQGLFLNRKQQRLVLKAYGSTIDHFTSAKQLLCALRDVISGENHPTMIGIY